MKKEFVILAIVFSAFLSAQNDPNVDATQNFIFKNLGKVSSEPSFSMQDYWVWGSSVVKGDDQLYHVFVSRWADSLLFHPGWMVASEIVHAKAKNPEGPYAFVDVALPARGEQYCDGRSTHNPRILRYKNKWVLYYMDSTHLLNYQL